MFKFRKKNLVYLLAGIALLLILSSTIPQLRTPLFNTLKYPLGLLTLIQRETSGIIFYHRNLVQNERLRKGIDLLRYRFNSLEEIELENRRLKGLLYLKEKSPYKVVAAQVIGRSPDNWSSSIIINKGRYNGINRGMVAISYFGLVGRVIESAQYSSKIILINDPDFAVSGIVKRSRQEGLVCGTLGNSLLMKYLPRDTDIQVSDTIITSGLTQMYPKGLLIGTVIDVGEEFSGLSRYAVIKPVVNLSGLEEILIIVE